MKQELIQLSEDAEQPGFEAGQVGPIQLVNMYVELRLAALRGAASFQADRLIGVFRIFSLVAAELATHELGRHLVRLAHAGAALAHFLSTQAENGPPVPHFCHSPSCRRYV